MDATLHARLGAIDWAGYETAYGRAGGLPDQLIRLARGGPDAVAVSHDLWCGLCHQHAYVSSAALPALPFILEALDRADEALAVEILDILMGFATCPAVDLTTPPWVGELRRRVAGYVPQLRELAERPNEDIAGFARAIVEALEANERRER